MRLPLTKILVHGTWDRLCLCRRCLTVPRRLTKTWPGGVSTLSRVNRTSLTITLHSNLRIIRFGERVQVKRTAVSSIGHLVVPAWFLRALCLKPVLWPSPTVPPLSLGLVIGLRPLDSMARISSRCRAWLLWVLKTRIVMILVLLLTSIQDLWPPCIVCFTVLIDLITVTSVVGTPEMSRTWWSLRQATADLTHPLEPGIQVMSRTWVPHSLDASALTRI